MNDKEEQTTMAFALENRSRGEGYLEGGRDRLAGRSLERLLKMESKSEGELLRDEGTHRVLAHSGTRWKEGALAALARRAAQPGTFCFEDVENECGRPPNHDNAIGALMRVAVKRGIIVHAGYGKATRKDSHARAVRLYAGPEFGKF